MKLSAQVQLVGVFYFEECEEIFCKILQDLYKFIQIWENLYNSAILVSSHEFTRKRGVYRLLYKFFKYVQIYANFYKSMQIFANMKFI